MRLSTAEKLADKIIKLEQERDYWKPLARTFQEENEKLCAELAEARAEVSVLIDHLVFGYSKPGACAPGCSRSEACERQDWFFIDPPECKRQWHEWARAEAGHCQPEGGQP